MIQSNSPKTVHQIEQQVADALDHLPQADVLDPALQPLLRYLAPPEGTVTRVTLRQPARAYRKVREDAAASYWSAPQYAVVITFESINADDDLADAAGLVRTDGGDASIERTESLVPLAPLDLAELMRLLDRAEASRSFIALKWFRDQYLPERAGTWASSLPARQAVIARAIQRAWILTQKVPNPRVPEHPVTAIRVNRTHPEVREILAGQFPQPVDFEPATLRGEPLSKTVQEGRR